MVSLAKNQTVSLAKTAGSPLRRIQIGLGWDPAKKSKGLLGSLFGGGSTGSIDLDASCVLMTGKGEALDLVWFRQLESECGSVRHGGDNLTGEGEGDDEVIHVDLSRLPGNVEVLAITVNSFRGQSFNEVDNAFCRVVGDGNKELVRYDLREQGSHTGVLIASIRRKGGDWEFKAHGKACGGRTIENMMPEIIREIR